MFLLAHKPKIASRRCDTRGDLRTIVMTDRAACGRKALHPDDVGAPECRLLTHQYWSGLSWHLGAAAYWEALSRDASTADHYSLGHNLVEEVVACLLGGYGVPASTAQAAFERLRGNGLLASPIAADAGQIEALLSQPLCIDGVWRRYRFPSQRAQRVAAAVRMLAGQQEPKNDRDFRTWLQLIPGVGPKTASWVVRNRRGSAEVAIIDIHIVRAGTAAGVFPPLWDVVKHYSLYEQAFLQWADHAGVHPAHLDACIWGKLARQSRFARDILGIETLGAVPKPVWPIDVDLDSVTAPARQPLASP